jgi:hypothetical protein
VASITLISALIAGALAFQDAPAKAPSADSKSTRPDPVQPDSTQPAPAKPDPAQPDAANPGPVKPDSAQAASVQPDLVQPDLPKADSAASLSAPVLTALKAIQDDVATLKKQNWIRDIGPSTVGLLGLIVSIIISVISLNRNAQMTRETLQSKAHEEERKSIREKRDRFYGPFIQLRGISKHLYEIFNARRTDEERRQFSDPQGKFRTLIALCRSHEFTGVDKVLLDEIVRIGDESASLITKEIGLVDNAKLQEELSRAAAHYRIIKLAAAGQLTTNGNEFDGFTFPHELDGLVQAKIAELDARLRTLEHIAGALPPGPTIAGQPS